MVFLKKTFLNQRKKSLTNNLINFLIILNKLGSKKRKFLDARVFVENLKKAMVVQKKLEYLKSLVGNAVESKVKDN